jgi:arsenate reductase (thioredoxin)
VPTRPVYWLTGPERKESADRRWEADVGLALGREVDRLADEFRGKFSRETIERCARETADRLQGARVRRYLPTFVYRFTQERLTAPAKIEGFIGHDRPEVLFVCVRNSGRSQIAAALTRHLSGGSVEVHSAGAAPAAGIRPALVEAMAELGLDLSHEFPKPLTDDVAQAADVIVTMGCGDACPVYPYKKYEDWPIEDPEGQPPEKVRQICETIRARVEGLLAELRAVTSR